MKTLIDTLVTILFIAGLGYSTLYGIDKVKELAIKRIDKGLSSSEELAQKLTGQRLSF